MRSDLTSTAVALELRDYEEGVKMKTIGAKLSHFEFIECLMVAKELGLSRSEYVRNALRMFNSIHYYRRFTEENEPVRQGGELGGEGRTEPRSCSVTNENEIEGSWTCSGGGDA